MLSDDSIVSGGADKAVIVWRAQPSDEDNASIWVKTICQYHDEHVWALAPLLDGRFLSGSSDGTIGLWAETEDSHEFEVQSEIDMTHGNVRALAMC